MSGPRLALRMSEVAEQLGVHRTTVQRWGASGELTTVRVGGTVRVLPADLDAFLQSHREGRAITAARRTSVRALRRTG